MLKSQSAAENFHPRLLIDEHSKLLQQQFTFFNISDLEGMASSKLGLNYGY